MNPSKWELFLLIGNLVRVAYKKVIKKLHKLNLKIVIDFEITFF